MRNKKTTMIIIVILTLLLSYITPVSAKKPAENTGDDARRGVDGTAPVGVSAVITSAFNDVRPSDWYFQYIEELAGRGLARGNPDGTYAPDAPLLIDEFLAFALRTMGDDLPNADGYWALNYIKRAIELGLIESGEYDNFDVPITREQIAEIVVKAASGAIYATYNDFRGIFSDIESSTNPESILKAIELGVLAGYEDGTFRPKATATRAEASVMVLRMIDESYRLELYGDIFFNAKTDLNENGVMKKDKAKDFVMEAVSEIRISISDNGNAVLAGYFPQLPAGQNYMYDVSIYDPEGTYLSYHTTAAIYEEQFIPSFGRYKIETKAPVVKIGHITITIAIVEGELPLNIQEAVASFIIYKYYYESDHANEGFIMNADGDSFITRYDFGITQEIWGW